MYLIKQPCPTRGTQTADSRWKSLQSWVPRSVKTLRRGRINQELMKYVRSSQWRFAKQHYSAEILGQSMKQRHSQRWDEEWKRATLSGRRSLVFPPCSYSLCVCVCVDWFLLLQCFPFALSLPHHFQISWRLKTSQNRNGSRSKNFSPPPFLYPALNATSLLQSEYEQKSMDTPKSHHAIACYYSASFFSW